MKSTDSLTPDRLTSDEIGAALERIVASDPFRTSPQLVAFLRFVVAATLAGHGDRLKGYTIAVEALGRSEDFDPQSDPIVRVEAARLRRALKRYYAEAGSGEPIVVELPRGSYIPVFHYRGIRPGQPVLTLSLGARPPERARALPLVAAAIAVLGVGIGLVWGLGMPRIPHGPVTMAIFKPMSPERSPAAALQPGSGLPVVAIQPFDAVGTPSGPAFALGDLKRKLSDALAQFDEIQVASAAAPARRGASPEPLGAHSDYWLAATAEYRRDGAVNLSFRLHDTSDGTVAWARTFTDIHRTDAPAAVQDDIVRQVVTTVAPPYGVIHARERALGARKTRDARYRCLLEAFDYRRSFDFSQRDRVRACLERVTAQDPTFAGGFAALAMLSIHDYYYSGGGQQALDAALKAAKRAVETDPESARAHHAMMNVLFARGQIGPALAEGEKAVALNSYDMIVLASYGMRLVGSGEIDKGQAALRQAASFGTVRPAMLDFCLFVIAYLNGDDTSAAYHASLITSETYPFGLLARALVAAKAGERDEARRIIHRLVALHPEWRDDPRAAIERYIRALAIVERLTRDLAEAGLPGVASDPVKGASFTTAAGTAGAALAPGWGMPLVSVQPFVTIGTPAAPTPALDDLQRKLRDALARFDEIEVGAEPFTTASRTALPKGAARGIYRLGANLHYHPDGAISLAFRLRDEVDGTLAWARSFDNIRIGGDADTAMNDIVRRLAATLAQPYGVIYARELAKRRGDDADPRYRCVLDTMEFRRIDDRTRHDHVRACLERTTALDPTFANGFALLAVLTLREYYELDDGGAEKLDRALAAAQLAVALKPQSARARQALMNALFARGKVAPALAEGDKAVALNPNDMTVLIGFGMRLVAGGEIDKAAEILQTAAAFTPVHTPILDFGLFVCDYLRGDDAGAAYRASLLTSETYPPALLARALVAAKAGDRDRARETIAKLVALYPAWNGSLQGKLGRFIPEKTIVDRIARDLAAAGLGAEN